MKRTRMATDLPRYAPPDNLGKAKASLWTPPVARWAGHDN
jgi:hypothetical protein